MKHCLESRLSGAMNFVSVAILLCLSCGGPSVLSLYEGEQQPVDQVAVVEINHRGTKVVRIDDHTRNRAAFSEETVEVLPGVHEFEIQYRSWKGGSAEPITLAFEAVAGHRYQIRTSGGYRLWHAWVLDIITGEIVAGQKP